ncbi:MAG: DNA recombination protein RmuC [Treponema sp.]|nr:DNA recombination protein RmuC [Treponema sp.]
MMRLLMLCALALLAFTSLMVVLVFLKLRDRGRNLVLDKFLEYEKRLDKNEISLKDEFGRNREGMEKSARESREELNRVFINFTGLLEGKIRDLTMRQEGFTRETREIFDKIRESVEKKLGEIQQDNSVKLEKMRETVDEKLHSTLEKRLGESFKIVSLQLEQVQKGLGEMQALASGVGDLKRVLSNVKTKGVLGEYQLGAILEQVLTPDQYAQNVKTKPGSNDMVEFAIRIPSREDNGKFLWLPIDAKFPSEDYEKLSAAYDAANTEDIALHKKELERKIRSFARDIKTKYVDPPATTDFAILFLPFEGLYAEVLRIPGILESIQREYRVTITGPTTVSAFLTSLQMGFRSLAVEKHTSKIWELLGKVRNEFGKFGDVLRKTREKIESAGKEIESAERRSRVIERSLTGMDHLGAPQEQQAPELEDTEANNA